MDNHEIVMSDQEFFRLYTFLKNKYGIDMSKKREIVSGRLENYMRSSEWNSFTEYLNAMEFNRPLSFAYAACTFSFCHMSMSYAMAMLLYPSALSRLSGWVRCLMELTPRTAIVGRPVNALIMFALSGPSVRMILFVFFFPRFTCGLVVPLVPKSLYAEEIVRYLGSSNVSSFRVIRVLSTLSCKP